MVCDPPGTPRQSVGAGAPMVLCDPVSLGRPEASQSGLRGKPVKRAQCGI